jgi:hypothetical protein
MTEFELTKLKKTQEDWCKESLETALQTLADSPTSSDTQLISLKVVGTDAQTKDFRNKFSEPGGWLTGMTLDVLSQWCAETHYTLTFPHPREYFFVRPQSVSRRIVTLLLLPDDNQHEDQESYLNEVMADLIPGSDTSGAGHPSPCVILVINKGSSFDIDKIYSSHSTQLFGCVEIDADTELFLKQVKTHYLAYQKLESTMLQSQRAAAAAQSEPPAAATCALM